jgi:hypothetical protein
VKICSLLRCVCIINSNDGEVTFAAMLAPHLSCLLGLQTDFGHPADADVGYVGDDRFGLLQNLACGAERGPYTRRVRILFCVFGGIGTEEAGDAEGHRQVV